MSNLKNIQSCTRKLLYVSFIVNTISFLQNIYNFENLYFLMITLTPYNHSTIKVEIRLVFTSVFNKSSMIIPFLSIILCSEIHPLILTTVAKSHRHKHGAVQTRYLNAIPKIPYAQHLGKNIIFCRCCNTRTKCNHYDPKWREIHEC